MKLKNIVIGLIILICNFMICTNVYADEDSPIKFETVQTGSNTFRTIMRAENIDLNYISGTIQITNGRITSIQTSGNWINRTGNSAEFYFYSNGINTGTYQIATIDVEITGNSEFQIDAFTTRALTCGKDPYNLYFGPNGTIVSEEDYQRDCFNGDATLKNLFISNGTLSPSFDRDVLTYTTTVSWNVETMTFTPIVNATTSTIISGTTCNLNEPGSTTTCEIIVKAENGTQKIYQIIVNREQKPAEQLPSDTSISNVIIQNGVLTTEFRKEITEYTIYVEKGTKYISFEYTLDSNGSKHIANFEFETLPAYYELVVTAEDGKTTKIYKFNILEKPEDPTEPKDEDNNPDENNPGDNDNNDNNENNNVNYDKGEVENPETGAILKPTLLIGSIILLIVGIIIARKKNIFYKI